MAHTVPTTGNDVQWQDIEFWVAEGVLTSQQMADRLNNDYRHHRNTQVDDTFDLLGAQVGVIKQDLGNQADPANDDPQWRGLFDDYHRLLSDVGLRNKELRRGWNRLLTKGDQSQGVIKSFDPMPTQDVPVDQTQRGIEQRTAFVLEEWDQVCQELTDDPAYAGEITGTQTERHQAVHDFWVQLTGGRRFGAVTAAQVDALIRTNQQEASVADVTARANNAVNAARQSFAADSEPAQIIVDGDNAYNTPI